MAEACASLTLFGKGSRRKRKQRDVEVDEKLLKCEKNGHNQDISADSDRRQSGSQCSTSPHPFQALGLSEHLEGVCASLGILHPTPVQKAVIPAILKGQDCIGVAKTGSGKTAAFVLPVIHRLVKERYGVYALVLTPTRELAYQTVDQFEVLGTGTGIRCSVVVGGMDQHAQCLDLQTRPHIVVASPGRLAEIFKQASDLAAAFKRTAVLVLDEADRILEDTFLEPLKAILGVIPSKRQTLLFTATMTEPLSALRAANLKNPCTYQQHEGLQTADNIQERYLLVPAKVKEVYLVHVLRRMQELSARNAIVFCSKRGSCEIVSGLLFHLGIAAVSLHSGKPQKARLGALHKFKNLSTHILVATDVAARGLDIPSVDLVVNFDVPMNATEYVHRVGRTSRTGRGGLALTFVAQYDVALVQVIEGEIGHRLEAFEINEGEALEAISKVFAARRAALLAIEGRRAAIEDRKR